jgi:CTP:molybdopterin cytidylyltransferase MocA
MSIPVIVLAAGSGERMRAGLGSLPETGKLGIEVAGRSVLAWTMWFLAGESDVLLVTRPGQVLPDDVGTDRVRLVEAPDAGRGMAWSLERGLAAVAHDAPGAVVVLADDPMACAHVGTVRERAVANPDRVIAVRRTPPVPHPVYLPRAVWRAPVGDTPDRGLRDVLAGASTIWIDDPDGQPIDLDVPDDLARLEALLGTRIDPL